MKGEVQSAECRVQNAKTLSAKQIEALRSRLSKIWLALYDANKTDAGLKEAEDRVHAALDVLENLSQDRAGEQALAKDGAEVCWEIFRAVKPDTSGCYRKVRTPHAMLYFWRSYEGRESTWCRATDSDPWTHLEMELHPPAYLEKEAA